MSSVYFLKHKDSTPVKIGFSRESNPKRRVSSYGTYCPYGIDFIGFVRFSNLQNGFDFEKKAHEFFYINKINREWFNISENQIIDFLKIHGLELNKTLQSEYSIQKNQIYDLYVIKKKSIKEVSELKNVSVQYVYSYLKKNRIKIRKEFNYMEFFELNKTKTVKEIAQLKNVSIQYVYKVLRTKV